MVLFIFFGSISGSYSRITYNDSSSEGFSVKGWDCRFILVKRFRINSDHFRNNKWTVCKSVNQKQRRIIYHQTKSTLLLWNTVVAYLGSWLFRFTGSCACPFWAVKHFSTPNSIAERANPTHRLSHSLSLSFQKTLTSVHIFFHQELPVKWSQLMQCRMGEEVGGRASCPAPTLLLLLFCLSSCFHFFFFFHPWILNTSASFPHLCLYDPHPPLTSCTNVPLVLDHCVLIAGLARYVGQAT